MMAIILKLTQIPLGTHLSTGCLGVDKLDFK